MKIYTPSLTSEQVVKSHLACAISTLEWISGFNYNLEEISINDLEEAIYHIEELILKAKKERNP